MVSPSKRQTSQEQSIKRKNGGNKNGSLKNIFLDKKIYLDLKSGKTSSCLARSLTSLGAVVEEFFCKDVDLIITDSEDAKTSLKSPVSHHVNGLKNGRVGTEHSDKLRVASRAELIIDSKTSQIKPSGTCDLFSNANKWGIIVWSLSKIVKCLRQLGVNHLDHAPLLKSSVGDVGNTGRKLKNPYVKIENLKGIYRPLYKEFCRWPELNLNSSHISPFAEIKPVCIMGNSSPKKSGGKRRLSASNLPQEQLTQKRMKAVRHVKKSGYCEICCLAYQDLKKHLASSCHQQSANSEENYSVLDSTISNGLELSDLVKSLENSSVYSTRRSTRKIKMREPQPHSNHNSFQPNSVLNTRVTRSSQRNIKSESGVTYNKTNKPPPSEFGPFGLYRQLSDPSHAQISVCDDLKYDDKIFDSNIPMKTLVKLQPEVNEIKVPDRINGCSNDQYLSVIDPTGINDEPLKKGASDYFNAKILFNKLRSTSKSFSDRKVLKDASSERFLDKENIDDNVAHLCSGVHKGMKRKRVSSDIALLIDNKEYYHLETLPERLRHNSSKSEGAPTGEYDMALNQFPTKTDLIEIGRLPNNLAKVDSDILVPETELPNSLKFDEPEIADLVCQPDKLDHNFNVSNSLQEAKEYLLSRVKNYKRPPSGSVIASNHIKKRYQSLRKRTHAEVFLSENKDYYKFEFPKSRLRTHGLMGGQDEYLVYKFGLDCPLKSVPSCSKCEESTNGTAVNNDSSTCPATKSASEPVEQNPPPAPPKRKRGRPRIIRAAEIMSKLDGTSTTSGTSSDMLFSFELEPFSEPWYETFQRSSESEHVVNSCPDISKPFLLPYEMPLDVILKRNSVSSEKPNSNCSNLPRKSPRCHASTLAMLSQWFPKKADMHSCDGNKISSQEDYNAIYQRLRAVLNPSHEKLVLPGSDDNRKGSIRMCTRSHSTSEPLAVEPGIMNGYASSNEVTDNLLGADEKEFKHFTDTEPDVSFFAKYNACSCMKEMDSELEELNYDVDNFDTSSGKFKPKKRKTNRTGWPDCKVKRRKKLFSRIGALNEEHDSESAVSDSSGVAESNDGFDNEDGSPYKFLRKRTPKYVRNNFYSRRYASRLKY